MKVTWLLCAALIAVVSLPIFATESAGVVILEDDFDRSEPDPGKEQVGNGWSTNSRSRAQGVKQVDLIDGAMHITRAKVADHGVSVTHEVDFADALISLRFKLGPGDDLGINIADMNEKSVHAGHICMARIRPGQVELVDLKTGRMNLKSREQRLAGTLSAAQQQQIKAKSRDFPIDLEIDVWYTLEVRIVGQTMTATIDGNPVGEFRSPGIGHSTKSRLRLAVNKSAWVDDVKVVRLSHGG